MSRRYSSSYENNRNVNFNYDLQSNERIRTNSSTPGHNNDEPQLYRSYLDSDINLMREPMPSRQYSTHLPPAFGINSNAQYLPMLSRNTNYDANRADIELDQQSTYRQSAPYFNDFTAGAQNSNGSAQPMLTSDYFYVEVKRPLRTQNPECLPSESYNSFTISHSLIPPALSTSSTSIYSFHSRYSLDNFYEASVPSLYYTKDPSMPSEHIDPRSLPPHGSSSTPSSQRHMAFQSGLLDINRTSQDGQSMYRERLIRENQYAPNLPNHFGNNDPSTSYQSRILGFDRTPQDEQTMYRESLIRENQHAPNVPNHFGINNPSPSYPTRFVHIEREFYYRVDEKPPTSLNAQNQLVGVSSELVDYRNMGNQSAQTASRNVSPILQPNITATMQKKMHMPTENDEKMRTPLYSRRGSPHVQTYMHGPERQTPRRLNLHPQELNQMTVPTLNTHDSPVHSTPISCNCMGRHSSFIEDSNTRERTHSQFIDSSNERDRRNRQLIENSKVDDRRHKSALTGVISYEGLTPFQPCKYLSDGQVQQEKPESRQVQCQCKSRLPQTPASALNVHRITVDQRQSTYCGPETTPKILGELTASSDSENLKVRSSLLSKTRNSLELISIHSSRNSNAPAEKIPAQESKEVTFKKQDGIATPPIIISCKKTGNLETCTPCGRQVNDRLEDTTSLSSESELNKPTVSETASGGGQLLEVTLKKQDGIPTPPIIISCTKTGILETCSPCGRQVNERLEDTTSLSSEIVLNKPTVSETASGGGQLLEVTFKKQDGTAALPIIISCTNTGILETCSPCGRQVNERLEDTTSLSSESVLNKPTVSETASGGGQLSNLPTAMQVLITVPSTVSSMKITILESPEKLEKTAVPTPESNPDTLEVLESSNDEEREVKQESSKDHIDITATLTESSIKTDTSESRSPGDQEVSESPSEKVQDTVALSTESIRCTPEIPEITKDDGQQVKDVPSKFSSERSNQSIKNRCTEYTGISESAKPGGQQVKKTPSERLEDILPSIERSRSKARVPENVKDDCQQEREVLPKRKIFVTKRSCPELAIPSSCQDTTAVAAESSRNTRGILQYTRDGCQQGRDVSRRANITVPSTERRNRRSISESSRPGGPSDTKASLTESSRNTREIPQRTRDGGQQVRDALSKSLAGFPVPSARNSMKRSISENSRPSSLQYSSGPSFQRSWYTRDIPETTRYGCRQSSYEPSNREDNLFQSWCRRRTNTPERRRPYVWQTDIAEPWNRGISESTTGCGHETRNVPYERQYDTIAPSIQNSRNTRGTSETRRYDNCDLLMQPPGTRLARERYIDYPGCNINTTTMCNHAPYGNQERRSYMARCGSCGSSPCRLNEPLYYNGSTGHMCSMCSQNRSSRMPQRSDRKNDC